MNDNTATVVAPAEPAQKRRWRPRKAVPGGLLTVDQCAELLQLSSRTIQRAIDDYEAGDTFAGLASVKIGWARRVSRRALNSWIERRGTGRAQRTEARNLF